MLTNRTGRWAGALALGLLAAAAAAVLWIAEAEASPAEDGCGTLPELLGWLAGVHGETLVGVGQAAGGVPAVLTLGAGGTWTLVVATPDGRACMFAAGGPARKQRDEGS